MAQEKKKLVSQWLNSMCVFMCMCNKYTSMKHVELLVFDITLASKVEICITQPGADKSINGKKLFFFPLLLSFPWHMGKV